MKHHQFTSKTEPALNDPLWLICRKTKQKQLCIGSQNIEVEYKLSNKKIKGINEECNLKVGVDDPFKADNYILSIVLRANGIVIDFISKAVNVV